VDINIQKELFSYAYIHAVVSATGYSSEITKEKDRYGIDLTISGEEGNSFPQLDVQVKCTSMELPNDEFIRYPLKLKNYNDLRKENITVPRILVVVLVPDKIEDWLQQSEPELCMKYCGYWKSLRGEPETKNTRAVTVSLPRKNIFNVDALKSLMQRIATGGSL
jgi:Domain of unknown function (DUF4365)